MKQRGPVNRGEPLLDIIDPGDLEIVAEPLMSGALRMNKDKPVQVLGLKESSVVYSARVMAVSRVGFVITCGMLIYAIVHPQNDS